MDTKPAVVSDELAALLRQMTPGQRVQISFDMWGFTRAVVLQRVKAEHPEWTVAEVQYEVALYMAHGEIENLPKFKLVDSSLRSEPIYLDMIP